jgi:hypothetical protein
LFSLDAELGWSTFDKDEYRSTIFTQNGSNERKATELLLDILEEFGIIATWAVVGHLFLDRCARCDKCQILEWRGKYQCFEEIYGTDHSLWYGADYVESLMSRQAGHEIAYHGYTHRIFDENVMSSDEARIEIQKWLRVSRKRGIIPRAVIFPRDKVGHLDLFKEAGFICYRSDVRLPLIIRNKYFGRYIKHIDHILNLSCPPIYELNELYDSSSGLMNFRVSQHIFGFNRRLETTLDSLGLHRVRVKRIIKGVRKAAEGKKVIHVWAHPWEFRKEKDFDKLRYLLRHVAQEMQTGRMRSIGMTELARIAIKSPTVMSNSGGES